MYYILVSQNDLECLVLAIQQTIKDKLETLAPDDQNGT